jgi:hypothetical protein
MWNGEQQEEDVNPVVEEVTATRRTGIRYNSERGYNYHKQKTT